MDNIEHRFRELAVKHLAGRATADEHREMQRLLALHPELQLIHDILFNTISPEDADREKTEAMLAYTAHYAKLHLSEPINSNSPKGSTWNRRSLLKWGISLAAAASLILVLLQMANHNTRPSAKVLTKNEVVTKKGSQSYIKLPDGSEVWLNGDSRLTYPEDFNDQVREVSLTGEGFFEVAKNPKKPFFIHTQSITIKVTGTSFNLRAYPDEQQTETSLITGRVEVILDKLSNQTIHMAQGQKLIVRNESAVMEVPAPAAAGDPEPLHSAPILQLSPLQSHPQDGIAEQQWKENKLIFDNEPFDRVRSKIQRWYNVTMVVDKPSLSQSKFTASFHNKTIGQVLEALKYAGQFDYKLSNDTVYIH